MADQARLSAEEGATFPWPPPPDLSVPGSFGRSWIGSTFRPSRFFRAMPPDPGLGWPLLYYLIIGVAASAADFFWRVLFLRAFGAQRRALIPGLAIPEDATTLLISFLLSPVILVVIVFMAAAVIHLMLMIVGGARYTFWATFGVLCFAYSPQIFSVVPFIGGFAGFGWMVVIAIVGLAAAHETDVWRALLAVALPLLVVIGLLAVAAVFAILGGALL